MHSNVSSCPQKMFFSHKNIYCPLPAKKWLAKTCLLRKQRHDCATNDCPRLLFAKPSDIMNCILCVRYKIFRAIGCIMNVMYVLKSDEIWTSDKKVCRNHNSRKWPDDRVTDLPVCQIRGTEFRCIFKANVIIYL